MNTSIHVLVLLHPKHRVRPVSTFKMIKLSDYEWMYSEEGNTMKADLRAGGLFESADFFF